MKKFTNYTLVVVISVIVIFLLSSCTKDLNSNNKILNYLTISGIIVLSFLISKSFLNRIEEYKLSQDPKLAELKEILKPMFDGSVKYDGLLVGLNGRDVLNEIELYKGDKSYTINKQKIYLCLRDEKGEYYHNYMLLFVLLHELGHVVCDEIGHTEKFNKIFDAILDKASDMGIYDKNYPVILDYCMFKKD